jgi:hypothetical protein
MIHRVAYLKYSRLEKQGKEVYYTDESWCNAYHQRGHMWRHEMTDPVTGRKQHMQGEWQIYRLEKEAE